MAAKHNRRAEKQVRGECAIPKYVVGSLCAETPPRAEGFGCMGGGGNCCFRAFFASLRGRVNFEAFRKTLRYSSPKLFPPIVCFGPFSFFLARFNLSPICVCPPIVCFRPTERLMTRQVQCDAIRAQFEPNKSEICRTGSMRAQQISLSSV